MTSLLMVIGWTLMHFVWQACVIALPVAVALRLCARATANTRYLIACAGLVAMVLAPIATARVLWPAAAADEARVQGDAPASMEIPRVPLARAQSSERAVDGAAHQTVSVQLPNLDRLAPTITVAWLAGVALLLTRMGGGWWRVRRLHRAALATDASRWQVACRRLAFRLGLPAAAHVVESSLVDVPTVVGWLRPAILLPVSALANLTPAQVEAILAHELAHIRRHDYLVNILQTLAETLLFYHPAVWWLSRRVRSEREHCCDDVAVAVCGDRVGYAQALASLEQWRSASSAVAVAATGGSLLARIRRILHVPATSIADAPRSSGWAVTLALTMLFTAGAGGIQQLPWSVRDGAPDVEAASAPRNVASSSNRLGDVRSTSRSAGELAFAVRPTGIANASDGRSSMVQPPLPPVPPTPPVDADVPQPPSPPNPPSPPEPPSPPAEPSSPDSPEPPQPPPAPQPPQAPRSPQPPQPPQPPNAPASADDFFAAPVPPPPPPPAPPAAPRPPAPPVSPRAAVPPTPPLPPASPRAAAQPTPPSPPAPPAPPVPPAPPSPPASGGFSTRSDGTTIHMQWNDNGDRFEIDMHGAVAFNDELTDVQSLSDGGSLTIRDWSGGARRTIEIRSSGGSLTRSYSVGGTVRAWDDEARRRLAEVIVKLVRRSGFGAESRVRSIFQKRGTAGVLDEIALLETDYARRKYFVALVDAAHPDANGVMPILEQVAQRMKSDYDRGQVLVHIASHVALDQRAASAYIRAVEPTRSDYERRRTLNALLAVRPLPRGAAEQAMRSAVAMRSDYDRSEVLRTALRASPQIEQSDAFLEAAGRMTSAYEKRRVLSEVVTRESPSAELKKGVVMIAAGIDSDYDRASVLAAFAERFGADGSLRQPFFGAVNTMRSDFEKRRVLTALANKSQADAETKRAAFDAAGLMRSDYDRAETLLAFLDKGAVDPSTRQAFVAAAERIRSAHDQNRVLGALVKAERK